jgi:hypothetical protein
VTTLIQEQLMSHPGATPSDRHKVVIIGSGFGGLTAAQALKRADVDIKIIAKTTHHLFQPLLYQVATGIIASGEIAPPTRMILRRQKNSQVLLGEVTHIDLANKSVRSELLGHSYDTPYDTLIVAAGAGQSYFGNDHFAEFAPGMKSIDDALERGISLLAHERYFEAHEAFEEAWRASAPAERDFYQGLVHVAVAWYQAGRGNRVGTERQLETIWQYYWAGHVRREIPGATATAKPSHAIGHGSPVHVFDRAGRIRVVYDADFKPADLTHDIEALLEP